MVLTRSLRAMALSMLPGALGAVSEVAIGRDSDISPEADSSLA